MIVVIVEALGLQWLARLHAAFSLSFRIGLHQNIRGGKWLAHCKSGYGYNFARCLEIQKLKKS